VIIFFAYILFVDDFPTTFLPTAILDSLWIILYIVFAILSVEIRFKELFLPNCAENWVLRNSDQISFFICIIYISPLKQSWYVQNNI
jgi:hypothetical protein